jgi:group I intron endonuclease
MYIGSTTREPIKRWNEHKKDARNGINYYLYHSMRKYGIENFTFEVIDNNSVSTHEDLLELETSYIERLNTLKPNGYNMTKGGKGGDRLYLYDEETRKEKYKIISNKNREIQKDPDRTKNRRKAHAEWISYLNNNPEEKQKYIEKCRNGLKRAWENKVLTEEEKERYSNGQKKRFEKESDIEKQERIKKFKEASGTARRWRLTFPNGNVIIIRSIFDYCKENNLPYNIIYGCHKTKKSSKHGWNLEQI